MESWVQSWLPRANAFCLFSIPPRPCEARSYEVLHLSRKIILISKREDLILQNTTRLRNLRADLLISLMNMSLVLRLPREMHLCRSSSKVLCACHTKRRFNVQKVLRERCALHILTSKCASRRNCVHFFSISTSKIAPRTVCFPHFDFEICFAPQLRALFEHLNFQKCSENGALCTFWLRNVLRAATACTFSTPQLPKVLW